MIGQTLALFLDSYRELRARALFWITLALSVLIAGVFAFISINSQGVSVFGHTFEGVWTTALISPALFYKYMFTNIAIPYWLGIFAILLALISTAGIFPDLLSSGSIDLYLSKPLSRLRFFISKYLTALLFVAVQVLLFSTISFAIIGIRGGTWEPRIFLAVPLVTLLFSFLYCVCVLAGLITRSTLAAILIALLFWIVIYAVGTANTQLTGPTIEAQHRVTHFEEKLKSFDALFAANAALPKQKQSNMSAFEFQRDVAAGQLEDFRATARELGFWRLWLYRVVKLLPRTAETDTLMSRWLLDPEPIQRAQDARREQMEKQLERRRQQLGVLPPDDTSLRYYQWDQAVNREIDAAQRASGATEILCTSSLFEVLILALSAWLFCRKDY